MARRRPVAGEDAAVDRHGRRVAGAAGREPGGDEARVERVAGAGRVRRGCVLGGDVEALVAALGARLVRGLVHDDRRASRPAFHDDRLGIFGQAVDAVTTEQGFRLAVAREEDLGRNALHQLARRPPAMRQQRPARGQVQRHERASLAGELHRSSAREPERLAEQRVGRQMEQIEAIEPASLEVLRPEAVGRPAVGDEGPLAVMRHQDADPAGPLARDTRRPNDDAV